MENSTDSKETKEEVDKKENDVSKEEKPSETPTEDSTGESKEETAATTPETKGNDTVPDEEKTEVKQESKPEDSKDAVDAAPKSSDGDDVKETEKDSIEKADDSNTKPEEEASKTSETKEIKKEDGADGAIEDTTMDTEPKSELVQAAEDDAKKNKDQPAPCKSAVRPNNRDVLFGRGKPFQNHPGNRKMLQYIDQYKRQYNESPRDQKRPIVEEIIGILTSNGGRFLRRYNEDVNSTWWTKVPEKVAQEKVRVAICRYNSR